MAVRVADGVSIPITLAMTFGFAHLLGIDIAAGFDRDTDHRTRACSWMIPWWPVIRSSARWTDGHPPVIAAWLGPTKLAHAILFATITNIVAYLPFLMLTGTTGEFLLQPAGRDDLRAGGIAPGFHDIHPLSCLLPAATDKERRKKASRSERERADFTGFYYRVGKFAIDHRWKVFGFAALSGAGRICSAIN